MRGGCGRYLRETQRLSAHLETDFLEERVQVVEQPAAVEEERWLQHLLVNLFIIQLLWRDYRAVTTKTRSSVTVRGVAKP